MIGIQQWMHKPLIEFIGFNLKLELDKINKFLFIGLSLKEQLKKGQLKGLNKNKMFKKQYIQVVLLKLISLSPLR